MVETAAMTIEAREMGWRDLALLVSVIVPTTWNLEPSIHHCATARPSSRRSSLDLIVALRCR